MRRKPTRYLYNLKIQPVLLEENLVRKGVGQRFCKLKDFDLSHTKLVNIGT